MSDSINLFESYLEIYEGKPVAAPADEPDPFGRPGGKYGGVKKGGGYDKGWQAIQRKNAAAKKEMREDRSGPRPTYLPRSRERDIGRHDDWKDKPLEWGERPEKAKKLRRRATAVIGTQRRQDIENNLRKEDLEYILDYLVSERYADTYDYAMPILESMSDEWREDIIDLSERTFHGKMPGRAIQTRSTPSGNYTARRNEPDQRDSYTKNSHAEMRERWKDQDRKEKEAKEAAKQKAEKEKRWRNSFRPPSRGVAHDEPSIRRRTFERSSKRTPAYVANMKGRSLDKSDPKQKARFNKIRKALKNKANWGQKSEELEYLLNYIISEGYADTYDYAISILESMSDEWREGIIDEANALDRGKDSLTKNIDRQYRDKPLRKTSSGAFLRRGVRIRGAKDHKPRNPHYGKYYDMQSKKRAGASYKYLAKLDRTQD